MALVKIRCFVLMVLRDVAPRKCLEPQPGIDIEIFISRIEQRQVHRLRGDLPTLPCVKLTLRQTIGV